MISSKNISFTLIHLHVTAVLAALLTAALTDQKTAAGYCACSRHEGTR